MKDTIELLDKYKIIYIIIDDKIYLKDETLNLSYKNIKGIVDVSMIQNLNKFSCDNNQITEIICNEKLKELYCYDNLLQEITCNEELKYIYCHNNFLTKIVCKKDLKVLNCRNNLLNKIVCNINLQVLYCEQNNLTEIFIFNNLRELHICDNPILKINNFTKYTKSDIVILEDKYYCFDKQYKLEYYEYLKKHKLLKLQNKYFIKRFKYESRPTFLYTYHNYTINKNFIYKFLYKKY